MDLRFKVWNGNMEVVEVLDDNFYCAGATKPCMWGRYVKTKDKFLTSLESYPYKTPKDAWIAYLEELKGGIKNTRKQLDDIIAEQDRLMQEFCMANREMHKS
jgi:hypothetical protein